MTGFPALAAGWRKALRVNRRADVKKVAIT
jgi:hypothetical protein